MKKKCYWGVCMNQNAWITEDSFTENRVIENREIAPNVFLLSVERRFDFVPGQWIKITTSQSIPPRMYSICSGKNDKWLQILYNIKPEGILTTQLSQLKKGAALYLSPPSGSFYPPFQNSWWIASGTGIAPFISQYLSESLQNVHLIHGARTLEGFYFQELLKDTTGLDYIQCCSGQTHSTVYAGRLTQYLKEYPQLPSDVNFFLCGSPEMVVDTRDILIQKGIAYSKIGTEIYF
jgi:ferredoxin/flavodoxin---NADP+ reductase